MQNCPPPGIYHGIPFDVREMDVCAQANPRVLDIGTYLSWDAISNSKMGLAKRSMAHFEANPIVEETKAMVRGTLQHTLLFEPQMFVARFAVLPINAHDLRRANGEPYDNPRNTSEWRATVAECEEANPGRKIIEPIEYSEALYLCDAIKNHDRAGEYMTAGPENFCEVAIVWDDPETGLRCKGRMDLWRESVDSIGDLKTSADISEFQRNIARFSYHRQAAFYCDGMKILTGRDHEFTLTAAETKRPFGVLAAPMGKAAIEVGRSECRRLLNQIAEARKSKVWSGYESPKEWQLPAWAQPKDEPFELLIGGQKVSL